ncbi:hypothetical protein CEUSTIGMA_g4435.t1 [Chlamydomonas eustigma]|uniref:Sugar phosphate transporter domain-containing protein n=1 Tax=Chlamydomonas eustigma TaxID=1157962 RepID=A0A250X1P0_9CHLO|nr:hypothetical protein CEUSTIGMA_g4435.t1 [Chlamydomonas eustigma]|eukprot:GAX76988.1 hypothetical protein CEUSTIGMA_g4435.t1 [Chlamydomonas eustigma]
MIKILRAHIMAAQQSGEARVFSTTTQLSAITFYLGVSTAMSFINKWALQQYPLSTVLLVYQMLASALIVMALKSLEFVTFELWSVHRGRQLFGITLFYVANTALSLGGLAKINIPIYTALKRLTPIFVLLFKLLTTQQLPPWRVSGAVLMVVAGCIIAGKGDLTFDLTGYAYSVGSCCMQAAYLVLVETQGAKGIPATEMLWYNSVTSLPMLVAAAWATGEWRVMHGTFVVGAAKHGFGSMMTCIVLCSTGGILLNFSMFLATVVGTALSMTLVGNIKTVLVLLLGFVLLGGTKLTFLMAIGITLNLIGGFWYGSLKFKPQASRTTTQRGSSSRSAGRGSAIRLEDLIHSEKPYNDAETGDSTHFASTALVHEPNSSSPGSTHRHMH